MNNKEFNSWVTTIIWLNIIFGGLRGIVGAITIMMFNTTLGVVALVLSFIGMYSLYKIMAAKKWALFIWVAYMMTACIINDINAGGGHFHLFWGLFVILLMFLVLQIRKNGVSAWSLIFPESSRGESDPIVVTTLPTDEALDNNDDNLKENISDEIPQEKVEDVVVSSFDEAKLQMEASLEENVDNSIEEVITEIATSPSADSEPISETQEVVNECLTEEPEVRKRNFPWRIAFRIFGALLVVGLIIGGTSVWKTWKEHQTPEWRYEEAHRLFCEGKTTESIEVLTDLASKDYVPAKTRLGILYLINDAIPLNATLGFKYLEEAAVYDTIALKTIIKIYLGRKCKGEEFRNTKKTKQFANLAIAQDHCLLLANFALGNTYAYENDYSRAYYYWMKSAKMGDCDSYRNIGSLYYLGYGCTEDVAKAKYYFERAIEIKPNDKYSLYYLGLIYEYGYYGVPKDTQKGRSLLKRAAELGNGEAQSKIAEIEMKLNKVPDL